MGISSKKIHCLLWLGLLASSASTIANENTDLLLDEQWALQSNSADTALANTTSAENQTRGTCASTPVIDGNTYRCDSFTAPGTAGVDINVHAAWELIPASNTEVVIGLIDTGIDYLHPDLKNKVWNNPGERLWIDANDNGIDDGCEDNVDLDNNGYVDDCHGINTQVERVLENGELNPQAGNPLDNAVGHGTNMAGVMGAEGNNSDGDFHGGIVGVTGFHDNIRIVTCASANMQTDAYATIPGLIGAYGTHDDILECFDYFIALKERGVNIVVVNGSGGASTLSNLNNILIPVGRIQDKYLLNTSAMRAAMDRLAALDINLVVAAGNQRWDIDSDPDKAYYPAAFSHDNIIAVGAINNQGEPWRYSSYGRWSVDVFAPGERILSTTPRRAITGSDPADFIVSDGTSQATAFVTGMIALAKTYPSTAHLSASELRRLLISSGKPLETLQYKSVSGKLARLVGDDKNGMLNCRDQIHARRHWPHNNALQVLPGEWFRLEVAYYNCHEPANASTITATIMPSGETFELLDDGVYPDKIANDGIYTGRWQVSGEQDSYQVSWGTDTTTQTSDNVELHTTILVDNQDRDTARSGAWWPTIWRPGFYGNNYRVAYASGKRAFTWKPTVTRGGYYEVLAHWPKYRGFSEHAEYTIHHGDSSNPQSKVVVADQSRNGSQWNSLGIYWFNEGEFPVELTNRGIKGTVAADAIKLRPVNPKTN